MATRAHCTNTSCSQALACILHRSVMMLAPTALGKKPLTAPLRTTHPVQMGVHVGFPSEDALSYPQGHKCTTVCMGPELRLLRLKRQKSNHMGSPLFCSPGFCLLARLSLPKCSLSKCEMITISGIKNVNDECYASGRMIK